MKIVVQVQSPAYGAIYIWISISIIIVVVVVGGRY